MSIQINHPADGPPSDSIRISVAGDLVRIAGELDLDTAPDLFVGTVLSSEPGAPLRLDLSEVTFIDSTAVGTLVQASNERDVVIVNASERVRRILELTGLVDRFHIS